MATALHRLVESYNYLNYDLMDPRSTDVFYISSPFPWMALVAVYVYGVKVLGPRLMRDRPPFQVEGIMKIYNIVQIIVNLFLFRTGYNVVTNEQFDWRCMPLLYDNSTYSLQIWKGSYWYFWLKVVDLLDTVFFVLRKKNNQITFLHVYHHAVMVFAGWMCIKYAPGGNPIILGLINVFVHAVMYTYYLITSVNSEYKKSIWWKKHLTQLQMAQFMLIALHTSQILFRNPCGYNRTFALILVLQNLFVFILFYDFYKKAYGTKKKAA